MGSRLIQALVLPSRGWKMDCRHIADAKIQRRAVSPRVRQGQSANVLKVLDIPRGRAQSGGQRFLPTVFCSAYGAWQRSGPARPGQWTARSSARPLQRRYDGLLVCMGKVRVHGQAQHLFGRLIAHRQWGSSICYRRLLV